MQGIIRLACAVPTVTVGNPMQNFKRIEEKITEAKEKGADIVLFPELSLSGYTCGDLFFQTSLLSATRKSISRLLTLTLEKEITVVAGAPLSIDGKLFDCGVVISCGKILGIIPKTYLDHAESRLFSSALDLCTEYISSNQLGIKDEYEIPVGNDLIFDLGGIAKIAVEIGTDLSAPISVSTPLSLGGAEIILNCSAHPQLVSSSEKCRRTVLEQSAKTFSGYAYVSAGASESTTDMVFSGQAIIAERGQILAENKNLPCENSLVITDIDVEKIRADRFKSANFRNFCDFGKDVRVVDAKIPTPNSNGEMLKISKTPFIPCDMAERKSRALEIFRTQVNGLKKRLSITGGKAVIGISGGLDSTLALLVCVEAIKELNLPTENVFGITMPCFGTSDRTYNNSLELMKSLGVTAKEINIKNACLGHFKDIGQDENNYDLTYENSQARERTQVLMDFSGIVGGIVVGTGDLSEMALGWCTYNGDHMSMYGVNSGVPKTLIPHILESLVEEGIFPNSGTVLKDIIATPISPELLPPDKSGKIAQETESIIGPYVLHDFFIYNSLRFGFSPAKIYDLAKIAFADEYSEEIILKYLKSFYRRFFTQQFKRDCVPGGMKIGSIGISPRGDLKMPSDASFSVWIDEVEGLK